ncbi:MAG TPA: class I SAM-dependent methyltransferase [Bacteroidales bacterium]|nr:class I SAM-dependent methyltransferase [Bacteroidales bacterium]HSA43411.1 class I SAM-dependent methyltransferase [Bacteroidales bacterium]
MECNICHNQLKTLFSTAILGRYTIAYYQCDVCGFVQTEAPYWLEEAYLNPVNLTDVGLLSRNLYFADYLEKFITHNLYPDERFLDFGGGYGILVRLLRDKGFDFWLEERYCENLFAQYFSVDANECTDRFGLVTAIEVFEHLPDPLSVFSLLFSKSDNLFFSTMLTPEDGVASDWWYLGLEHGQHISFFSLKTLAYISDQLGCQLYTNKTNLHFLTRNRTKTFLMDFKEKKRGLWGSISRRMLAVLHANKSIGQIRNSLVSRDIELYKQILKKQH